MIKLELSFKTVGEAANFLNQHSLKNAESATVAPVNTPDAPAVLTPAQKAKATKARKKAEKEAAAALTAAMPVASVPVEQTAAAVMQAPVVPAAVPAAPVAPSPTLEGSREHHIQTAVALMDQMQSLGVSVGDVQPKLQEIYQRVGVAWCKVSELNDMYLPIVVNEMKALVAGLQTPQAAVAPAASYI